MPWDSRGDHNDSIATRFLKGQEDRRTASDLKVDLVVQRGHVAESLSFWHAQERISRTAAGLSAEKRIHNT